MSSPRACAGLTTSSTSCARAAAKRAASAQGAGPSPPRIRSRIFSPKAVPPGSRVVRTSRPSSRKSSETRRTCVDLPDPSTPSNVMNIEAKLGYWPVRVIVTGGAGFIGSHVADALAARGDEVMVLDNLSTGRRENVPLGAQLVEADLAD